MSKKLSAVRISAISVAAALPFFYFGKVVGFAALMLALGVCIHSGALSGALKKTFWILFLVAGFIAMGWAVIPLALIAYALDQMSSSPAGLSPQTEEEFDPFMSMSETELLVRGYTKDASLFASSIGTSSDDDEEFDVKSTG